LIKRLISFVIPCYRSEKTIRGVVEEILELHKTHMDDDYEIILVSDASPDNVWDEIQKLSQDYPIVKGMELAKNSGQHAALLAGYKLSTGDIVVSLDDDGQIAVEDTYKIIDHMYEGKGYDVVYGKYAKKKQSGIRNLGSRLASWMGIYLLDFPKDMEGSSFYAARRFVIDEMCKYTNAYVYLPGLVFRSTKNVDAVLVKHRAREVGESNYTFLRLFSLWVNGATTFSIKPLRLATFLGCLSAFAGVVFSIVLIIRKLLDPSIQAGWASQMCVTLVMCGTILLLLGVVGEYVGRIYMSENHSPQYVIRRHTANDDNDKE
jgi:undecaprenyl-phosphate 4-deoxy-4-formamido-L-arabinose transferase